MKPAWWSPVLNAAGLLLSAAGVNLLVAGAPPRLSVALLAVGLLSISAGTLWMVALLWRGKLFEPAGWAPAELPTAMPIASIANGRQLVIALQNFQDRALELIERRRVIHHLNTRESHYVHHRETDDEIQANKRYREARNDLDYQRLASPLQFWSSIDGFREAVEEKVAHEVYTPPSNREVYAVIGRRQQRTLEELNQIAVEIRG